MSEPVKEQLSACLDGELPAGELDLLLRQLDRDPHVRGSLGRYALIGETLRAQGPVYAPADFAQRVSAAIAAETEPSGARVVKQSRDFHPGVLRWLRPAAGFAVAAGVAAIAVISLRPTQQEMHPAYVANGTVVTQPAAANDPSYIVPESTRSGFVPAARLTNYVVAHSEYSTPLGRRSVLSGMLAEDDSADELVQIEPADPAPDSRSADPGALR